MYESKIFTNLGSNLAELNCYDCKSNCTGCTGKCGDTCTGVCRDNCYSGCYTTCVKGCAYGAGAVIEGAKSYE